MGFSVRSLFCYAVLSLGKREVVPLPLLSSCCLVAVIVLWCFLTVLWIDLQFVIVVLP